MRRRRWRRRWRRRKMLSRNFARGRRVKYEFIILITFNAHLRALLADVKLRELFVAIKRDSEIFSSCARGFALCKTRFRALLPLSFLSLSFSLSLPPPFISFFLSLSLIPLISVCDCEIIKTFPLVIRSAFPGRASAGGIFVEKHFSLLSRLAFHATVLFTRFLSLSLSTFSLPSFSLTFKHTHARTLQHVCVHKLCIHIHTHMYFFPPPSAWPFTSPEYPGYPRF